jgi:hypothetical protein
VTFEVELQRGEKSVGRWTGIALADLEKRLQAVLKKGCVGDVLHVATEVQPQKHVQIELPEYLVGRVLLDAVLDAARRA